MKLTSGTLAYAVHEQIQALQIGSEKSGLVKLALTLAQTIDNMTHEQRATMLGQTAGQLTKVLAELGKGQAAGAPRSGRLQMIRAERAA